MRTTTGTPDFRGKNSISPESLLATKPLTKEPEDSGYEIDLGSERVKRSRAYNCRDIIEGSCQGSCHGGAHSMLQVMIINLLAQLNLLAKFHTTYSKKKGAYKLNDSNNRFCFCMDLIEPNNELESLHFRT